MKTKIHSKIMDIEVDGSTVKYRFRRNNAKTYEIRGVSGLDLATLRAASNDDSVSASATVEYLTHLYPDSNFDETGKNVRPSSSSKASLKKKTPWR